MRNLYDVEVNRFRVLNERIKELYGSVGDDTCGAFEVPSPKTREKMFVLASVGDGWDHISVSCRKRCPTWDEMTYVKRLFFKPDEVAYQLHVGVEDHVNFHVNCLHLWRPLCEKIPLPPKGMIGPLVKAQREEFYEKNPY